MNRQNVLSLNFENAEKHKKGMATEDSALRILASTCRSLKMEILQRVLPPMHSHVGECDAVIFSDSGILLVEVKRIGGNILKLNETDETLKVEKGRATEQVRNPILTVKKKAEALRTFVRDDNEWRKVNELFQIARLGDGIPVYPVLCFGPTTNIEESMISDLNLLIATTRTLKRSLVGFLSSHPGVIGVYRHSKIVAHRWRIQGVVRVLRKPGFVRAFPLRAQGAVIDFVDVASIEGRKTGALAVTYRDRITKVSKDPSSVVFSMIENGNWIEFEVSSGTAFTWKAGA